MLANVRRVQICNMIKEKSVLTTTELANIFNVSIETIRKDLLALEKEGALGRVHGGAVVKPAARDYISFSDRKESMRSEKISMAQIAMRYINPGDIIAIDCGSTAIEFTEVLMEHFDRLTVVTHSYDVFSRLCKYKNFRVLLCGGFFLKEENAFYGDFAVDMMDNIKLSKAFIFPGCVSLNNGLTDSVPELMHVQRSIISSSEKIFVLADSSKFEKSAMFKFVDASPAYTYITDNNLSKSIKDIYCQNGIDIVCE